MKITFIFITSLFLLQTLLLTATDTKKSLQALKIEDKIKVDGKLLEKAWQKAPAASGFIQFAPDKGAPASLQTEVRVVYNKNYISFK